jgi:hypothetical protein
MDKASVALDCNTGVFSDENDMPGMAHAVGHVLDQLPPDPSPRTDRPTDSLLA